MASDDAALRSRRSARARVVLLREELARSGWSRLGWLGLAVPLLVATTSAGGGATGVGVAASSVTEFVAVSTWACGLALALAIAGKAARDPALGWLCALSGASGRELRVARLFAAVELVARRLAVGWLLGGVAVALLAREPAVLPLTAAALVHAAIVGLVFGGVASLAGELAAPNGRLALFLALGLPWLVEHRWFGGLVSVPGVLSAVWATLARHALLLGGGA